VGLNKKIELEGGATINVVDNGEACKGMRVEKELKPCPCCGASASFITKMDVDKEGMMRDSSRFFIRCDNERCWMQTPVMYVNRVEEIWNKRV
jgi:hypothetical protein